MIATLRRVFGTGRAIGPSRCPRRTATIFSFWNCRSFVLVGRCRRAVIAARKAEFAYDQTLTPPAVIVGQVEPEKVVLDDSGPGTQVLRGLPASAGVVTGPARW